VDPAHAALLWLYALKAPERLPPEFRADLPEGAVARLAADEGRGWALRCGTTVLRGLRADLARLPPAERAEAEALLTQAPRTPRGPPAWPGRPCPTSSRAGS